MVVVTMSLGAVILLLMLMCGLGRVTSKDDQQEGKEEEEKKTKKEPQQQSKKKSHGKNQRGPRGPKSFSHPLLAATLKEHSDNILDLDFSINGKYLASCAEDRTVRLWSVKDFKEKEHKCVRGNVEYDHATRVKFSPDCKAFITSLAIGNTVRVFKTGKKDDGAAQISAGLDFPKKSSQDIINIGLGSNSNGSFVMTAYRDTTIHIWDTKGEILATLDTHHMNNNYAAVSPCGRFVASCGFTPDVKVWAVVFNKGGEFVEVRRAMELKGHKASVYYFSFNIDTTRTATVSKDGTWKLWDTEVEYNKNQDPYLLYTGSYTHLGPSLIALSADANSLAIAHSNRLWVFNTKSGEEEESFEDVHTQPIAKVAFDPSGRYLATTGDRHLRILHNVTGLRANILDMETKMKKHTTSKALKERLEHQIQETRNKLAEILGETKEE
ncbi:transducin beta-like protein 2 [Amphiura filiformis]|uniref:transducin beta-like protein 2 n=1 Tax=Amphiura filiformis TaxID=82378 RepID=UPI003B218262